MEKNKSDQICESFTGDYSELKALFINCTLKLSPKQSHTALLLKASANIMQNVGVSVETIRAVDLDLAPGVYPDMTEHGAIKDDWPKLKSKVMDADILVLGTPIWLGEKSSVCSRVIERLYGESAKLNEKGQYIYYGKVGGCVITGNEDGIKHCAMGISYALQHLGYTIPPQSDCGWIGEAGPGPSYGDDIEGSKKRVGFDNEFTMRNTTFMTWNLMHLAHLLKKSKGIPAHGNLRAEWDAGCHSGYENPEYR